MNAIILNGANDEGGLIHTIPKILTDELERRGYQTEHLILRDLRIESCRRCFGCWWKTPGICMMKETGFDIMRKFVQSNLVILLTPVTFGGYSYHLKKAVDRMILLTTPDIQKFDGECHHPARYHTPNFITIGTMPAENEETARIFKTLIGRNARNFQPQKYGSEVLLENYTLDKTVSLVTKLLNEVEGDLP